MHSRHAAPGLSSDDEAALHLVPPITKHQGTMPSWKWSPHREYGTLAPPLVPFVVHQHIGSSKPASKRSPSERTAKPWPGYCPWQMHVRTLGDPCVRSNVHRELRVFSNRGLQRCARDLGNHDERDPQLRRVRCHASKPRQTGRDITRVDHEGRSSTGELCNLTCVGRRLSRPAKASWQSKAYLWWQTRKCPDE